MPRGTFDRSLRKSRTRAALLDAAARVYARHGFAGATLDEVAEEAGFTKGAIYAQFESKSGLLVALFEEYVAAEIAEQVALFDRDETTWRRPLAGSDRYMDELDESPDLFRLLIEFWLLAQRDDELRARFPRLRAFRDVDYKSYVIARAGGNGGTESWSTWRRNFTVLEELGLRLEDLWGKPICIKA